MSGLIPQAFIDDLLCRVDIVDVIDRRIRLKKSGRSYSACCPFHQEKTPSFNVVPEKQFYHCFGCGVSGNAIGFLMAFEGLDFPSAVDSLAASVGLSVPHEQLTEEAELAVKKQKDIFLLLKHTANYYRNVLAQNANARSYIEARGLSPSVIETYGIGYAPPGWDGLSLHLLGSGWSESQLIESGMSVEREGTGRSYDRFRERLMFPIHDSKGQVIGFGGRVLGDEKPKYINSPETAVFSKGRELYGLYEAACHSRKMERLVVVEGYMDVVALAQFGVSYAVAALGTAISSIQIEKAFRYCNELIFCFDGDAAGRRAAGKALDASLPLLVAGKTVKFLFLVEGEDPDSYIRSRGKENFVALLDIAQPLSSYLFEVLADGLSLESAEGRAGLITKALPVLYRIPEGPFRQQLFIELSLRTQSDINLLERVGAPIAERLLNKGALQLSEKGADEVDSYRNVQGAKAPIPQVPEKKDAKDLLHLQNAAAQILLAFPQLTAAVLSWATRTASKSVILDGVWLVQLANLVAQYPGASSSRLLGLWHGLYQDSEWLGCLAPVIQKECLVADAVVAVCQMNDILGKLDVELTQVMPLEKLILISKERPLTELEKHQLKLLIAIPRSVDAQ
jgi:DNA primase